MPANHIATTSVLKHERCLQPHSNYQCFGTWRCLQPHNVLEHEKCLQPHSNYLCFGTWKRCLQPHSNYLCFGTWKRCLQPHSVLEHEKDASNHIVFWNMKDASNHIVFWNMKDASNHIVFWNMKDACQPHSNYQCFGTWIICLVNKIVGGEGAAEWYPCWYGFIFRGDLYHLGSAFILGGANSYLMWEEAGGLWMKKKN